MKKKLLSLALALTLCLGLLPVTASAAKEPLPDWYFLFAIFKNVDADGKDVNGKDVHITYTMSQEEVDLNRALAAEFEEYMNSVGVIRAHVDVAVIDTPVAELYNDYSGGSYLSAELAAPLLKVDLDRYDHVTCILDFNISTSYAGITPGGFENGTGLACSNHNIQKFYQSLTDRNLWHIQLYVHEFLHFMERMSTKWGDTFALHRGAEQTHYTADDGWESYYTDVIRNRLDELDVFPDGGTGVNPAAWQYPPHVLRTMTELTVPSSATGIGDRAFQNCTTLTRVTIPHSVASIGDNAFTGCTNLTNVTIPSSVTNIKNAAFVDCASLSEIMIPSGITSIGDWMFGKCTGLTRATIPAGVKSINYAAFWNTGIKDIYYSGTETQWNAIEIGEFNNALTRAAVHCNHLLADVKTSDWFAKPVEWALENGITAGTGGGNFSPNATCTQAQILTFLWRACGSPVPAENVSGSAYYAIPFQWAKEQKITSGTVEPESPCTRSDVVTYLWRLAGSPKARGNSFTDVPSNAGYAQAVSWAVREGVTAGLSDTQFGPENICTRGQIVTFLHSALSK